MTARWRRFGTANRRVITLVALCVGQLMIVLDATVVYVALPVIQHQLHFSQPSLAWVVDAYLLTFGGLLLLAGRIGDLIGRRTVFLVGLVGFVSSSLLCGFSPSAGTLVAARFLQGASATMVASMVLGIIAPMYPEPRERAKAFSVFAAVTVTGGSLGLVLGGAVTDALGWHWIFFINAPVGLAAFVLGRKLLPKLPGIGLHEGADILGSLLVTSAPMLAVYGLFNAGSTSWGSTSTIASLIGAVVLAIAFLFVESRVKTPLIPLRVLRHRNLIAATVVRALSSIGGYSFNFVGALYLEHVLNYSPLRAGVSFLPNTLCTSAVSLLVTPWAVRRFGLKAPVVFGLGLATIGLFGLTRVSVDTAFVTGILPTMLLSGIGFGLMFMPTVLIGMSAVTESESGVASGMINVAVQLGASIGVAALAAISATRTAHLAALHVPTRLALSGGYRFAFYVIAGATFANLISAIALLRPHQKSAVIEPSL